MPDDLTARARLAAAGSCRERAGLLGELIDEVERLRALLVPADLSEVAEVNRELFAAARARDRDAWMFGQIVMSASLERAFSGPSKPGDVWPDWVYRVREAAGPGKENARG